MEIKLNQFGTTLSSRENGKAAYAKTKTEIEKLKEKEIIISFDGISSFSPSWGDEYLTPLKQLLGNRLKLKRTENMSVNATMEILQENTGLEYRWL